MRREHGVRLPVSTDRIMPERCQGSGSASYDARVRWPSLLTCISFLAVPAGTAGAMDTWLIDDRRSADASSTLGPEWRFFTDGVMGGVSSGAMTAETVAGRDALCLRGEVRLDNNGGFIQMALDLPPPPENGAWRGVELEVLGNGHRYGVHLRTRGMLFPWQAWRASFEATPQWRTLRLPFDAFTPYRTSGELQPHSVRRLGIVAIGERFDAELCVARLVLYR